MEEPWGGGGNSRVGLDARNPIKIGCGTIWIGFDMKEFFAVWRLRGETPALEASPFGLEA